MQSEDYSRRESTAHWSILGMRAQLTALFPDLPVTQRLAGDSWAKAHGSTSTTNFPQLRQKELKTISFLPFVFQFMPFLPATCVAYCVSQPVGLLPV